MFRRGSSRTNSNNTGGTTTSDFTILFDVPNETTTSPIRDAYSYYSSSSSSCSSPVDCTLSLGPASTRRSSSTKSPNRRITGSSSVPNIYWDVLSRSKQSPIASSPSNGFTRGGAADFLLPRRCANCDTTSTPLWRNGPRGPKSLCNACGIRYKKEERLAAATAAVPPYYSSGGAPAPAAAVESQHRGAMGYGYTHDVHPWAYPPVISGTSTAIRKNTQSTTSMSSSISGRWSDENDGEDAAIPYYSWCL